MSPLEKQKEYLIGLFEWYRDKYHTSESMKKLDDSYIQEIRKISEIKSLDKYEQIASAWLHN